MSKKIRPAKGVVIRSGAHRGQTVYGIPDYTVRLAEHYGGLITSYLKREAATAAMREATQGRAPAEVEAIREALFWRVFKEIEPRLHVDLLSASFSGDDNKGIDEWLEATLGRGLIKRLSREVAQEKAWEALSPRRRRCAREHQKGNPRLPQRDLLLRPKVRNPKAVLRREVRTEGSRHRVRFGKTWIQNSGSTQREHSLGTEDQSEFEVHHRAAARLEKATWPWRRGKRVEFSEADLKEAPVVFDELESKELLETLIEFYNSEASTAERELLEALFEHGTPEEALRAIGDEGKYSRWQAIQRKLKRRDPRN